MNKILKRVLLTRMLGTSHESSPVVSAFSLYYYACCVFTWESRHSIYMRVVDLLQSTTSANVFSRSSGILQTWCPNYCIYLISLQSSSDFCHDSSIESNAFQKPTTFADQLSLYVHVSAAYSSTAIMHPTIVALYFDSEFPEYFRRIGRLCIQSIVFCGIRMT